MFWKIVTNVKRLTDKEQRDVQTNNYTLTLNESKSLQNKLTVNLNSA